MLNVFCSHTVMVLMCQVQPKEECSRGKLTKILLECMRIKRFKLFTEHHMGLIESSRLRRLELFCVLLILFDSH